MNDHDRNSGRHADGQAGDGRERRSELPLDRASRRAGGRDESGLGGDAATGGALDVREFDALLNAALDAEATGDIAVAQESWARIAAMDEARRRSAALLASGLAHLKHADQPAPDVSARVLARLELDKTSLKTMPDAVTAETAPAREEAGAAQAMDHSWREARWHRTPTDGPVAHEQRAAGMSPADALAFEAAAEAAISTGRPWGLPSQRAHRKRRWYHVSPMLASFLLGGAVTVGLMMLKQRTDGPIAVPAPTVAAVPQAAPASQLVPDLMRPALARVRAQPSSLQLGDTARYTRIDGLAPGWRMSQTPSAGRWWDVPREGGPMMAFEGVAPLATGVKTTGSDQKSATMGNTLWFNMLEKDDVLDAPAPLMPLQPAKPRPKPPR
jgi:hypothetical protein